MKNCWQYNCNSCFLRESRFLHQRIGPRCNLTKTSKKVESYELDVLPFSDRIDRKKQIKREGIAQLEITKEELAYFECKMGKKPQFRNELKMKDGRDIEIPMKGQKELVRKLGLDSWSDLESDITKDKEKVKELYLLRNILIGLNEGEVYLHPHSGRAWLKLNGRFYYNSFPKKKRTWGSLSVRTNDSVFRDLLQKSDGVFIKGRINDDGDLKAEEGGYYNKKTGKRA